ncbi:MAG: hypothetical protein JKZ03_07790 [Flavobacteriaceae bacterium]|nr:hypothetical protein [Flavobacteriaceae bacterium]
MLWEEYLRGKQTYLQLSKKYKCSKRTIQRKIDLHPLTIKSKSIRKIIILMDTTYWGRSFGVMLFKDALTKENLLKYYVRNETNYLYIKGIKELESRGYKIVAIVCDGRKGLVQSFGSTPVQMCQFHQVAIIRRYITKNPKLPASIELKELVAMMKLTDKESFEGGLELWFVKWESFLNERTINLETNKSYYTHKRLRSAYRSLKSNLPWLFTWYDYIELNIPNTTNAIDGHFADLKNKLRNHNGLSKKRKMKFIDSFLKV